MRYLAEAGVVGRIDKCERGYCRIEIGQKYARGLVQGPACPVFVCRGLGMVMLPVRLGSVPEIAVIELRCAG